MLAIDDLAAGEACLRRAIQTSQELINYLALFSTLRRADRAGDIKALLTTLDLASVKGTPGQKLFLAQQLFASGMPERAFAYAYDVLQDAKNDPEAALRYFGLMMLDPKGHHMPRPDALAPDVWVQLEDEHAQTNSFLVINGPDRPADGILSPSHPLAAPALGLKVGDSFTVRSPFGVARTWRIAEIKHKYLHALHEVMATFPTRFPNAKGFYTIRPEGEDMRPALDEIRRFSEANSQLADLYLVQHLPLAMVAARLGRDSVTFADFTRFLGREIVSCIGTVPERAAECAIIAQHRAGGAVLDAYAAWTAATMDGFDILQTVFVRLALPQSCMDELRSLMDRHEFDGHGPSLTIAWHNGQFYRQEFSEEENSLHAEFLQTQLRKIEHACEILPAAAPDEPTELAALLTDTFGVDVLDVAHVASTGYVLVSEDLYYRQAVAEALRSHVNGACLQSVFAFARDTKLISDQRYATTLVQLARRRHSHVWFTGDVLYRVWESNQTGDLSEFRALAEFVGTRTADIPSHINVVVSVLNRMWGQPNSDILRTMAGTSVLLNQLIRFRTNDWPTILALVIDRSVTFLGTYIQRWRRGHFLDFEKVRKETASIVNLRTHMHISAISGTSRRDR